MRVGDELADRYRLEQRLGKGGFGEVWRAHDTALDRAVAVKVLLETAMSDEAVARFRREATIGARLQHPGITVVHDVGQEEGQLFIVMELLAGEDLRAALSRVPGGLPAPEALELAAQVAEALAAAHERSVIHRDLKPANLFLLPSGRLKICDFGIAHSSDATAGWTVTGRIFGSPPYMAPEQWRGERVDARCDLYALGGVLYALLSGEPPFGEAEVPYVLMRRHIEDRPLPLREAGAPVEPEVERLVQQLLEKAPADRPESAQAVAAALRALLAGGDGSGGAVGIGPEAGGRTLPGKPETGKSRGRERWGRGPVGDGEPENGERYGRGPVGEREPEDDERYGRGPVGDREPENGERGPVGGGPGGVQAFVRELLREAAEELRELPAGTEARVEVLAVAADAAARFDAGLATRLLADAEVAAWTDGEGDGARVARLLTALARGTAPHAPARSRRLLTDARQALFTVFGAHRAAPLRAVAEQLALVAPEEAAELVGHHFVDGPAGNRLRSLIATATAAAHPEEAELRLARIEDPGLRAAATYDMVLALAPRDLDTALRLSERIGSAGARLLALCQVARDRARAGDTAGGARALEQAEAELPEVLQERAAWLREEAAAHAAGGRLGEVQAERLRSRASALLRRHPEAAGDEKADHALASLAAARERVERGARPAPAPERARERAGQARALPDPARRARELAAIARECVATAGSPWLAEAAADPGSTPPHGVTVFPERRAPAAHRTDAEGPLWRQGSRPDSLYAAGDGVVWLSGPEAGCLRVAGGLARWTAFADEGVSAGPLPGAGRVRVSCMADAATVYVTVRREGSPEQRLLAREPGNGRVRWWRDLPREGTLRGAGPRLLHEAGGELTTLLASSGAVLWQRSFPEGTRSLAVAGDCLVLSHGQELQALYLSSGRRIWSELRGAESFERTPAVQPVHLLDGDNGTGSGAGRLRALDRSTGRELWQFALGSPAQQLLVEGGRVYAAAFRPGQGDVVFALDANTGALRWQRALTRRDGPGCAVELLGLRPGGLYVKVPGGLRRGLLNRSAEPFVAVLDPATGKVRRQWERSGLAQGGALLIGDHLVLSRPELSAYALP